jgi:hypothetical protein
MEMFSVIDFSNMSANMASKYEEKRKISSDGGTDDEKNPRNFQTYSKCQ